MVLDKAAQALSKEPTPQSMRVVEVNEALAPAYAKASTLELTDDEIEELTKPFGDDKVEVRPHDGLIYIPHIHISDRLNQVLRPGKWSLICRRHWLEGNTMYGEYILLIRGCYVGESVGGHPYQPNNPKVNYSDTLESTAAEALRRIAGKRLSCGSQVWDPSYANEWCHKYRGFANGSFFKRSGQPAKANNGNKEPTQKEMKEKAKKFAERLANVKEMALQYCIDLGWILPTEGLEDVPYSKLPKTEGQFKQFRERLERWAKDGTLGNPYEPLVDVPRGTSSDDSNEPPGGWQGAAGAPDPDDENAEWRSFPMTHGKHAGKPLAELDKKYLYGLWANFTVETTWTNSEGKVIKVKPEKIALAKQLREMLDQAGTHYEFTKKD